MSKLRAKQLRRILHDLGSDWECTGCSEKGEFVKRVEEAIASLRKNAGKGLDDDLLDKLKHRSGLGNTPFKVLTPEDLAGLGADTADIDTDYYSSPEEMSQSDGKASGADKTGSTNKKRKADGKRKEGRSGKNDKDKRKAEKATNKDPQADTASEKKAKADAEARRIRREANQQAERDAKAERRRKKEEAKDTEEMGEVDEVIELDDADDEEDEA